MSDLPEFWGTIWPGLKSADLKGMWVFKRPSGRTWLVSHDIRLKSFNLLQRYRAYDFRLARIAAPRVIAADLHCRVPGHQRIFGGTLIIPAPTSCGGKQ
jgi:hypothetical protein